MTREIKFRGWDKKKKEIFYSESEQEDNDEYFDLAGFFNYVWNNDLTDLMQFTGLKDKNGKEIFEGDIIKRDWKADGSLNEGFDLFVCELQGQRWLHSLDGNEWSDIFEGKDEIIGNKFENPELLEGKK